MTTKDLIAAMLALLAPCLAAQVPHTIRFQGSVLLNGTGYEGIGLFKFALVNAAGDATFWSNDGSSGNGREPASATPLFVSQGDYAVNLGDTSLTNMLAISPAVFRNSDVFVRVWFSDGTNGFQHVAPDQKLAAVAYAMMAADVADGAITSAKLAAGAVTRGKLAANAVTRQNLATNSVGPEQLAAGAAAANLKSSGGLVLTDLPIPTNLITAGMVKIGTVTAESDSWKEFDFYSPPPRMSHAAIWTGTEMIILGGFSLTPARGFGARYNPTTDSWAPLPNRNELTFQNGVWTGRELLLWGSDSGRVLRYSPETGELITAAQAPAGVGIIGASVVWTAKEMIVCCGTTAKGALVHRAAAYDPVHDSWRTLAEENAPSGRQQQAALWTGRELLVWGGEGSFNIQRTGGVRYDVAQDVWKPISTNNAPPGRVNPAAVWTGKEMIIWGGSGAVPLEAKYAGGRYDPATDTWHGLSTNNAPPRLAGSSVTWTGTEMIVWGGALADPPYREVQQGWRYDPGVDKWTAFATTQAPSPRAFHSTVWTGTELIVWGGGTSSAQLSQTDATNPSGQHLKTQSSASLQRSLGLSPMNSGARYRPDRESWTTMSVPLEGRTGHSVVWTGSEAIVWGGRVEQGGLFGIKSTGARFNPMSGRWTAMNKIGAPSPRENHAAIWTGAEMIIWGGNERFVQNLFYPATGAIYDPVQDRWREINIEGAPFRRVDYSAVWTGSEMIVWGGMSYTNAVFGIRMPVNSGARYNPQNNSWTSTSTSQRDGAPEPRQNHVAVWTGSEMIIWGGLARTAKGTNLVAINSGSRYDPRSNTWKSMSRVGAPPSGRGVWSGRELIVWNGREGGRYDPLNDSWQPISMELRTPSTSLIAWLGTEVFFWGGAPWATGDRYNLQSDSWFIRSNSTAPPGRINSAGVWTGREFLIFGGLSYPASTQPLDSVLSYSPKKEIFLYGRP